MVLMVEGGEWRCDEHSFQTADREKWNEHCRENADFHTESGSTYCVVCKEFIQYNNLPFHDIAPDGSKNIQLKCDECTEKTEGKVKRTKGALKK